MGPDFLRPTDAPWGQTVPDDIPNEILLQQILYDGWVPVGTPIAPWGNWAADGSRGHYVRDPPLLLLLVRADTPKETRGLKEGAPIMALLLGLTVRLRCLAATLR